MSGNFTRLFKRLNVQELASIRTRTNERTANGGHPHQVLAKRKKRVVFSTPLSLLRVSVYVGSFWVV